MSGLFPAHVAGAFVPIEVVPLTAAAILYWHRVMVLSWDDRPVPAGASSASAPGW